MAANERPRASGGALELLQRGLQALGARDWEALRSLCDDDCVWRIPGRNPLAGKFIGPDAIVARFQLMASTTVSDRPAQVVALLDGQAYAAAVQQNTVVGRDGSELPFTTITLVRARGGRLVEVQNFPSDQYMLDELWSDRL